MRKAVVAFMIVIIMTILSLLLTDFIFSYTSANVMETLLIANLLSISLAVWLFDMSPSTHPAYRMRLGSIQFHHPSLDQVVEEMKKETPSENPTPVTPKGMTKKGDKLSPEHRAKISASLSLKKRSDERRAQDERIAKTQKTKLSRKKSGK